MMNAEGGWPTSSKNGEWIAKWLKKSSGITHFHYGLGPIQTHFVAEDLYNQGKYGTEVEVQVLKHMLP